MFTTPKPDKSLRFLLPARRIVGHVQLAQHDPDQFILHNLGYGIISPDTVHSIAKCDNVGLATV
jgi:hypothetical protein